MGCTYSGKIQAVPPPCWNCPQTLRPALLTRFCKLQPTSLRCQGKKPKGWRRVSAHQNSSAWHTGRGGAGRKAAAEGPRITSGAAPGRSCRSASTGRSVPAASQTPPKQCLETFVSIPAGDIGQPCPGPFVFAVH